VKSLSPDEDIVAGLLAGEPWAAEQLYERVHGSVRDSLRRILRGSADYDDLMQASFERILSVLSHRPLRPPYNLPAWAGAVAARVALDALRRRTRELRLFDGDGRLGQAESPRGHADPERTAAVRAEVERAQKLLTSLKPDQAEALVLHEVLGHDLHAIAELTGVSVAAAQSRLSRGRRKLLERAHKLWQREAHGRSGEDA
jgi:RNA polymerase sigma-70 factor (ECF subfamily)